jgi:hypothetical protein
MYTEIIFRKYFLFVFFIVLADACYGLAIREDFTDHYYNNPKIMTTKLYDPLFSNSERLHEQINIIEYKELINGVYGKIRSDGKITSICYNLNYGNNINNNELRFYTLLEMNNWEYVITLQDDSIVIEKEGYVHQYNNSWSYRLFPIVMKIMFDETKKLDTYEIKNIEDNKIIEFFKFIYDDNNRLISVNAIQGKENILRKSIYYDGIFRGIPRPYFRDNKTANLDEIIIYDGNILKYHTKIWRNYGDGNVYEPDILSEKEEKWYHVVFEYDKNGNRIKQTQYRNDGYIYSAYIEYIKYDKNGNWIEANMYNEDDKRLIATWLREIIYYE